MVYQLAYEQIQHNIEIIKPGLTYLVGARSQCPT